MTDITDSDDTVLDMPREAFPLDKEEPLDRISTAQRIMAQAKAHPIFVFVITAVLGTVAVVLIGAHDTTTTQPLRDELQNAAIAAVRVEVMNLKDEVIKVTDEISDQSEKIDDMTVSLVRIATILEIRKENER